MAAATQPTQQADAARPRFALEAYEDKPLPEGQRLRSPEELAGHTIKCAIENPWGRLGEGVELVLVTETLCWITFFAEVTDCGQYGASLSYGRRFYRDNKETLFDYLSADEMRENGLVSNGQFYALQQIEADRIAKEKEEKATDLRKQLAQLEGGAA